MSTNHPAHPPEVAVLCGGPGLGFYVPGVVFSNNLNRKGIKAGVDVVEYYFKEGYRANAAAAKKKFHDNFRFALLSQKTVRRIDDSFDPGRLAALFEGWQNGGVTHFVVFSGFWLAVLQQYYRQNPGARQRVTLVHLDADHSTSWKLYAENHFGYEEVWFFNFEAQAVNFYLDISHQPPVPFAGRLPRYLVHGGGWGIGTYREKIPLLERHGLDLDVVHYSPPAPVAGAGCRHYALDPNWHHWTRNEAGRFSFPPFGEMTGGAVAYRNDQAYPELFALVSRNKAIISKPGAGTLLDSLVSATPLVTLEPFGGYEDKNGQLWVSQRLGVTFEDWQAAGFSETPLLECHQQLLARRRRTQEFTQYYQDRLHGS